MILAADKDMNWTVEVSDPGTYGWNWALGGGIGCLLLAVFFLVLTFTLLNHRKSRGNVALSVAVFTCFTFFALIFLIIGGGKANDPLDDREYAQAAEEALIARGITSPPAWKSDIPAQKPSGGTGPEREDDESLGRQGDFDVYTGTRSDDYCRVHARQLDDQIQFKASCLPDTPQAVTFPDRDAFDAAVADAGFTAEDHEVDLTTLSGSHSPSAFDTTRVTLNSEHLRCSADLADGQVSGSAHQVWVTSTTCPISGWDAVRNGDPEEF